MKINIVTEPKKGRWVLYMMSEQWKEHLPNCTITEMQPDPNADINFYVNWKIYSHSKRTKGLHVGWFTHLEPQDKDRWETMSKEMDYCICPSNNTLKLLPPHKSKAIKHGINKHYVTRPTRFGIVARQYSSGRKQYDWINKLKDIPNAEFLFTDGKYTDEQMPNFYKNIDYLLVIANNEGGPVPVLESLAMNKPTIAPDVGWCWEYPCIKYTGFDELKNIVTRITSPVDTDKLWKDSTEELLAVFKTIHEKCQLNNGFRI